ncbi:EAL domain-containing protein [Bosea sp. 117]|uniref:putative bifunctional diguanylate cyclase/phosphodiesterase n=1 Tax=Bosea sp. 117 TaxID=1125973 RepID=UPI00068E5A6B|nr:EAL domain-containing protein [Bosea sp. 117]
MNLGEASGGDEPAASPKGRKRAAIPRFAGPGDRIIIAVALVVVAAIAAMGAFSLVAAERIDAASRQRWSELVTETLERRAASLERDLASFAHWDESVLRTAYFLDVDWVHRNFGRWLHDSQKHDRSYIVLDSRVGYAAIDGELVPPEKAPFDAAAIMPLVRQVQDAYMANAARVAAEVEQRGDPPDASASPTVPPVFRAGYVRHEGRPVLIGAISITPDYGRVISPTRSPPVAVTVLFLEGKFLGGLASELHVTGPQLAEAMPADDRMGVPIPFADPNARPAWLTWIPENPGSLLLGALLPALIGTAVLLLAAAAIVLWYARRATYDLAESEALASRLAYIDPLCGLANRAMLMRVLADRLTQVTPCSRLALFFVDLDGFKDINDTLGHHFGDLLLAEVGSRLNARVGKGGLAARFGGDEFVLLIPVSSDDAEIERHGEALLATLAEPIQVAGQTLMIGGSIGATVAPDHGLSANELIRLADIAVYRAKAEGRGAFRLFQPEMESDLRHRREVEIELAHALKHGGLEVHYQPQLAADGETLIGCEALVRWMHPTRGAIPPAEFMPIAEQAGLVTELDMWVLRRACQQARNWGNLKLGVNLSPVDFRLRNLTLRIGEILEETGFDPRRLEIEITENLLFGNHPDAFNELAGLRSRGVRIALDDFGSGYSSLGYIRRFRVDSIKIDKSFTQNIGRSDDAPAIIDCVVRLARALGITVTAEGVETREQLRYLQTVGCHNVQGFLFGAAAPASHIETLIARTANVSGDTVPRQWVRGTVTSSAR